MVSLQNYQGKGLSIALVRNNGFIWQHYHNVSMKGYFFYSGKLYNRVEEVAHLLHEQFTDSFPNELINQFNGVFCLVVLSRENLYLIADNTRSFPLFYSINVLGFLAVSDDFYSLVPAHWKLNAAQKEVFLHAGFTIGKYTIVEGVNVLDSGEYLYHNAESTKIEPYYQFGIVNQFTSYREAYECARLTSDSWVTRLIASVQGRTIVIPLSGGYDSRYIIAMLKRKGYEKVIAYTYGVPHSEEVAVSRRVAEALQYPWIFVDYTTLDEFEYLLFKENSDFYKYSHGGVASPHVQDMMAVKYLMEHKLIPANSVVVPGICGDVYGGSQIGDLFSKLKEQNLPELEVLLTKHICHLKAVVNEPILCSAIKDCLATYPSVKEKDALLFQFDQFYLTQKINKFVVNSCKVYEHFGLEWRLPLMDSEFARTWLSISPKLKIERNLYKAYLFKEVFAPLHINFEKKKTAQQKYGWFLKYIPTPIFRILRFFYKKKIDHNSIFQKLRPFMQDLSPDEYEKHFINPNHIFSVWALKQLVNKWLPHNKKL